MISAKLNALVASFQYVYPLLINAGSRFVLAKSFPSDTALIQRWQNAESFALS